MKKMILAITFSLVTVLAYQQAAAQISYPPVPIWPTPTITVGAGAGLGGSFGACQSGFGCSNKGLFTITTGTSPSAGAVVTLTWASAQSATDIMCQAVVTDGAATTIPLYISLSQGSTSSITWNSVTGALLPASKTLYFEYGPCL